MKIYNISPKSTISIKIKVKSYSHLLLDITSINGESSLFLLNSDGYHSFSNNQKPHDTEYIKRLRFSGNINQNVFLDKGDYWLILKNPNADNPITVGINIKEINIKEIPITVLFSHL